VLLSFCLVLIIINVIRVGIKCCTTNEQEIQTIKEKTSCNEKSEII